MNLNNIFRICYADAIFGTQQDQIKLKETALERSTNTFLEKEKDLHNKIEELQGRLEGLNQSSFNFCQNEIQKVSIVSIHI